jgi:hypothetical protein
VQGAAELVGELAQPGQPVRWLCVTATDSDLDDVQLGTGTGSPSRTAPQQVLAPGPSADGHEQPFTVHALIVGPVVTQTTLLNGTLTLPRLLRRGMRADDGVVMEMLEMLVMAGGCPALVGRWSTL